MGAVEIRRIEPYLWEIPVSGAMLVPGRVYASAALMEDIRGDESLQQVRNVATLPGIVGWSLAMPDIHWGYGFPRPRTAPSRRAASATTSTAACGWPART